MLIPKKKKKKKNPEAEKAQENGVQEWTDFQLFFNRAIVIYFTLLQTSEYYEAPFTISDGVYGSI